MESSETSWAGVPAVPGSRRAQPSSATPGSWNKWRGPASARGRRPFMPRKPAAAYLTARTPRYTEAIQASRPLHLPSSRRHSGWRRDARDPVPSNPPLRNPARPHAPATPSGALTRDRSAPPSSVPNPPSPACPSHQPHRADGGLARPRTRSGAHAQGRSAAGRDAARSRIRRRVGRRDRSSGDSRKMRGRTRLDVRVLQELPHGNAES